MTSNRPQRKGQTPAPLPLHPSPASASKQVISVEEWEAKAPLGDLEVRSINAIKAAAEKVPYPLKFAEEDDPSASGSVTPVIQQQRNKLVASASGSGSRPSTPSGRSNAHALHPKQPIQTPQQFYDWFALIDRSVAHSQESHFRTHVASVSEHLETCDLLLDRIAEIDREVDGMMEGWRGVEEGGKNLKDACERLLEERDRLLELTDDIGSYLEYFQELEPATRMLNHPGESLIFQSDFLYMVERVDICIDFLKSHRHFKESEVYLLRYQQCMTRAMTLIKMNFVGSLRALSSDVSTRLSEKDVSPTAQMHLLYTRFRTVSKKVAPLLGELERRALAYPDELSALLSECHSAYFYARKQLLVPRILEEIKGLDPSRSELVELTRAGCSYLKQLCTDEFNLYREFFRTAEDQLYQYLETLCDFLYDDLRPRILHEPRLTALCEVCTVLQALMVLDAPSSSSSTVFSANGDEEESGDDDDADRSEDDEDDDVDELTIDLDNPHPKGKGKVGRRLHISHLLQMVLQDAQTRLFFKAQSVIQSDIRYYVSKAEELAYPDILISARKPQSGNEIREKESVSQIFQLPSLDKQDTWYPTMRKMVWVLSQLHDFVKPAIFEDIAQEAANLCRQSLVAASEAIQTRSGLDGHLFLVRNLLILKEIARNLDLDQRDTNEPSSSKSTTDFGGVTETFANLLSRTTSMLPDGLFASLGVTRGEDGIRGVKHGIDHDLRRACENVISVSVDSICEPLQSWAERIHAAKSIPPSLEKQGDGRPPPGPLAEQVWASRSAAETLNLRFREACERDMRSSVARLRLYLEDDRTVRVLVEHMQDRIMDAYAEYREVVWGMYAGALREREGILSPVGLREVLRDVCGEVKGVDEIS